MKVDLQASGKQYDLKKPSAQILDHIMRHDLNEVSSEWLAVLSSWKAADLVEDAPILTTIRAATSWASAVEFTKKFINLGNDDIQRIKDDTNGTICKSILAELATVNNFMLSLSELPAPMERDMNRIGLKMSDIGKALLDDIHLRMQQTEAEMKDAGHIVLSEASWKKDLKSDTTWEHFVSLAETTLFTLDGDELNGAGLRMSDLVQKYKEAHEMSNLPMSDAATRYSHLAHYAKPAFTEAKFITATKKFKDNTLMLRKVARNEKNNVPDAIYAMLHPLMRSKLEAVIKMLLS